MMRKRIPATVLMRRGLGVNALTQPTENTILDTTAGACRAAVMEDLRLVDPTGLAVRGETLFVCDSFARTILEYTIE